MVGGNFGVASQTEQSEELNNSRGGENIHVSAGPFQLDRNQSVSRTSACGWGLLFGGDGGGEIHDDKAVAEVFLSIGIDGVLHVHLVADLHPNGHAGGNKTERYE